MKKIFSLIAVTIIISIATVNANNILLSNVSLNGQNTVSQFSLVNFDVSWENSWRTITNEANYDGAWIFVKFRKKTSSLWQHATINTTGSTMPSGSVIQTSADGKGVWIYHTLPATDFTGNVNYTGAKIQWNYGTDGVLNTDSVEIRVFALEMVYVPQGKFNLGSGGTDYDGFFEGSKTTPYSVTSETTPITVANTVGNLYYNNSNGIAGDQGGPIPANFPKGFNPFWLMKYESSQQQYVDFLNNLDLTRANNRYTGVFTGTHPNLVAPFPERAANTLSIADGEAFADWAGLRPFTEMEYEKACRGFNQASLPNEFVWGNTTISPTTGTTNTGFTNETANDGNANYGNNLAGGRPTRTGIYATATSNRQQSGGTFYGIMDMSGNVTEPVITVGNTQGRSFTNVNGDGTLNAIGDANVSTWPDIFVGAGYGLRGGYYSDLVARLQLSDRYSGTYNAGFQNRAANIGIRLARTAE
ncbi:MAG: SUMF1/EgtB/PvdO family nonheme iron enzyme [Chitinophagaceae bacterium]|nr:SUMF1/EgtB/PvdO family nonheme iron enzyme [Chitinophagaceae bacterium]